MDRGYIKIWRKAQDSSSWARGLVYQGLIVNLLMRACWKESHYQGRTLKPGQFGAVLSNMAEALNTPRSTVVRMLKHLQADNFITIENVANRFCIITIVNWNTYQQSESSRWLTDGQPMDDQRLTDGQPSYKEEEGKKERKIQDSTLTSFECLSPPVGDDAPATGLDGQEYSTALAAESPSLKAQCPERKDIPPCPYEQIRDMYHAAFPEHPRVALLSTKRKGAVKARWGDAGKRLRELKRPDSAAERLAYFQRLFNKAAMSDFLTGKRTFRDGSVYRVDFDKLMSPGGFVGVIEGKYDNRPEA